MGSSFSLRSCARLGSSLSLYGMVRMGSNLSVLDMVSLGSVLSLRSFFGSLRPRLWLQGVARPAAAEAARRHRSVPGSPLCVTSRPLRAQLNTFAVSI